MSLSAQKADVSGCLACVSDSVQVGVGGHGGGSGSGYGGSIVVPTGLEEGEDERIPQVVHRQEGTTKAGITFTGVCNHTTQKGSRLFQNTHLGGEMVILIQVPV